MAEACESDAELFDIMGEMLKELRDGHVNLVSVYGTSYYWDWKLNHPINFSDSIQRNYLDNDFRLTNGIKYKELPDSIGYIYVESFGSDFSNSNLTIMLNNLKNCKGIVLDIRQNGGGMLTAAEKLASVFTDERIHYGYIRHKTGKGHNDFSEMYEQRLKATSRIRWQKPVVVLTNRGVYSAANEFTKYMKALGAIIVGDHTGGGAGMPFTSELPNGWLIRFSACPTFDINKQCVEEGIAPHHNVSLTDEDTAKGKDTIIEYARKIIKTL
jgi:C-terminal processing protease CtpA/Prc